MAETEFTAGEGGPDQLPRGEATRVNEGTDVQAPSTEAQEAPGATESAPEGGSTGERASGASEAPQELEMASPGDFEPIFEPETDDEDFVTSPTYKPDEPQYVGSERSTPISPRVRRVLPAIQKAAEEPGASPALKELVRYIMRNS